MNPSWAPARLLALAAVLALLLVAATYVVATHQPWLGIEFRPNADNTGLEVVSIHPRSPNHQLRSGDVVTALVSATRRETISGFTLVEGNAWFPTYETHNRFLAHHRELATILREASWQFELVDGRRVAGTVTASRPGWSHPWYFWFLAATGVLTFLLGVAIWAFRRGQSLTRLALFGVTGFLVSVLLAAIVQGRELTLSPVWMQVGLDLNTLGVLAMAFSLVALCWYYPTPIGRVPVEALFYAVTVFLWLVEYFQYYELPYHAYVTQYGVAFAGMLLFAVVQWRRVRDNALERAALQWFLLSILIGSGIVEILFFIPLAYRGSPIVPVSVAYAMAPLIYLGLAFGITRYRLFDLERWWLEVWLWLGGGLLVIGIDVLLITFFQLADLLALGFALILAGWVYLPLRQWLFRRVLRPSRTRLDDHFPLLIEALFENSGSKTFAERWRELVQRVFQPMSFAAVANPAARTALAESGLALQVPSFDGRETFELRYREQGRQLYTPRDAKLADSLLSLTRRAAALWQERDEGARTERHRIMRDLHDDVAARLLTLVHRVPDREHQSHAREALTSLRQVIYALDEQQPLVLADLLVDLQAQLRERARSHGIEVRWQEPESLPAVALGAREQINLTRILSEATSNALRHGSPSRFTVNVWTDSGQLHLTFCNDGARGEDRDWVAGKGLNNILNRMQEIGGEATWTMTEGNAGAGKSCCVELWLPLADLKSEP